MLCIYIKLYIKVGDEKHGSFNRVLNAFDLTVFGVGSMIGAGIFVMTGVAAATKVLTLSFLFSSLLYKMNIP